MKYIALLRGINVGGNHTVPMARLKEVFLELGFQNVSTYINSGNVIFETKEKDSEKLGERIEKVLEKEFGFEIKTVVRDAKNIQKLCEEIPAHFANDTEQKTDVLFLWNHFDTKATLTEITINPEVDTLLYIPGAIVWNVLRKNYGKSGMHKFIGTKVYKHMTARNVNTVRELGELIK